MTRVINDLVEYGVTIKEAIDEKIIKKELVIIYLNTNDQMAE